MRIKERWRSVRDWCGRTWDKIRPGPEARKGAIWGAIAVALWIAIVAGIYLQSGFGLAIDIAFALTVAALGVPLVMLAVWLIITLLRKLPRWFSGFLIGVCLLVGLAFPAQLGIPFGAILLLTECTLGAAIALLLVRKKIVTAVFLAVAIGANIAIYLVSIKPRNGQRRLTDRTSFLTRPASPRRAGSGPAGTESGFDHILWSRFRYPPP